MDIRTPPDNSIDTPTAVKKFQKLLIFQNKPHDIPCMFPSKNLYRPFLPQNIPKVSPEQTSRTIPWIIRQNVN